MTISKLVLVDNAKPLHLAKIEEINIEAYQEFFKNVFDQVLDCFSIRWEEVSGQMTLDGRPMPVGAAGPKQVVRKRLPKPKA